MSKGRVIPAFNELEDGRACLGLGTEAVTVEEPHYRVAKKLSHRALS
jgi:hypothetical protein